MKIQLALDRLTKEECIRLTKETLPFIDWIEIGTGVIKEYGMDAVKEMKRLFPNKPLVADMKTCDAGKSEAEQAFGAGADVMTVMAFAHDRTIREVLNTAEAKGKTAMVDLLQVTDRKRIEELRALGADFFCLHIGKDTQEGGRTAGKDQLSLVSGMSGIRLAIAGGMDAETVRSLRGTGIEIAIIGSAIAKSENPASAAKAIKEAAAE